jgi:hypothetical protein
LYPSFAILKPQETQRETEQNRNYYVESWPATIFCQTFESPRPDNSQTNLESYIKAMINKVTGSVNKVIVS